MTEHWLKLTGKRVLVAGGGGLGAAICAGFVEAGARVHVVDIDEKVLAQALEMGGPTCSGTVVDIASRAGAERAVQDAVDSLGGLDVLMHAVGINQREPIDDIDEKSWQLTIDVNTASFLWLAKAARKHLGRGSRIVAISSVSGVLAHPNHGSYAASKGALNQLVRVMAIEWAADGIAVNGIAPAYTITPLTEAYVASGHEAELIARVPAGRLGRPEDVVGPALLLASPRAEYVTGQVLLIDGGRTLD
jgi:gluconate 5-dehydrogenase/2-deoxy-D-gluconate 3-dehydrogenase